MDNPEKYYQKQPRWSVSPQQTIGQHMIRGNAAGSRNLSDYNREAQLRKMAFGRENTFFFMALGLFGDKSFATKISNKYDKKYNVQERLDARKELASKYKVKTIPRRLSPLNQHPTEDSKKPQQPESQTPVVSEQEDGSSFRGAPEAVEELSGIQKTVAGLTSAVASIVDGLKAVTETTTKIMDTVSRLSLSQKSPKMEQYRVDGKDYLYYPDAPEHRQVYDKNEKTNGAGPIASREIHKKVLKKVKTEFKRKTNDKSPEITTQQNPIENLESILNSQDLIRKSDLMDAINQIKTSTDENIIRLEKNLSAHVKEALTLHSAGTPTDGETVNTVKNTDDPLLSLGVPKVAENLKLSKKDQEDIVFNALFTALKTMKERYPDMFKPDIGADMEPDGINSIMDDIPDRSNRNSGKGWRNRAKGAGKSIMRLLGRGANAARMVAGGISAEAVASVAAPLALAGAMYATQKAGDNAHEEWMVKAVADGDKDKFVNLYYNKLSLDQVPADLWPEKEEVEELYRKKRLELAQPTPTPQQNEIVAKKSNEPDQSIVVKPMSNKNEVAHQIIDQNRKLDDARRMIVGNKSEPIINYVTNNNMTPTPKQAEKISVFNDENTFNRLTLQDVDHPNTYSNFNMG